MRILRLGTGRHRGNTAAASPALPRSVERKVEIATQRRGKYRGLKGVKDKKAIKYIYFKFLRVATSRTSQTDCTEGM